MTALDIGMSESSDRELLVWAAREGRVLITHDRKTMPKYAAALLKEGKSIAGILVVSRRLPLHQVLKELELAVVGSDSHDWIDLIDYLPL